MAGFGNRGGSCLGVHDRLLSRAQRWQGATMNRRGEMWQGGLGWVYWVLKLLALLTFIAWPIILLVTQ